MNCSSIKCAVMNCHFNAEGLCEADAIEVKPQAKNSASSSLGTYCETFVQNEDAGSLT
ncbi:MAG: DUF1540 domain-containing protein [Solirubrobacterales bacterium]